MSVKRDNKERKEIRNNKAGERMTKETWNKHHTEYTGKHAPKFYKVYRVLSPTGPEETFVVLGLKEARQAICGCWDYDVTDLENNPVNEYILRSV